MQPMRSSVLWGIWQKRMVLDKDYMRRMHKTNGNMSGQHRRTKWVADRHARSPELSENFSKLRRLSWAGLEKMTDEQLKTLYLDYKLYEAFYTAQENRCRDARLWARYYRREVGKELKKRGVVVD